ncbi:hypothetical protein [Nocardia brasiliensis]|uniref:hypothetical protein n=1 Tax=Nocardia brasiliensis TaxID=37326 RepID=UPI00367305B2
MLTEQSPEIAAARSAHYTAAQAVAYIAHGVRFRFITLQPIGQPGVTSELAVDEPLAMAIETAAIISVAGPAAEAHYLTTACGWRAAQAWAHVVVSGAGDEDLVFYDTADAIPRAQHFVDQRWTDITAVAHFLLTSQTLTCKQVCAAIGSPMPSSTPDTTVAFPLRRNSPMVVRGSGSPSATAD